MKHKKPARIEHRQTEYQIQAIIVDYLRLIGCIVHSVPNESAGGGHGAMIRMQQYRRVGLLHGVADLVVWLPTDPVQIVYVECKTPRGRVSEHQREFAELCRKWGVPYVALRSLDDAIHWIELSKKNENNR